MFFINMLYIVLYLKTRCVSIVHTFYLHKLHTRADATWHHLKKYKCQITDTYILDLYIIIQSKWLPPIFDGLSKVHTLELHLYTRTDDILYHFKNQKLQITDTYILNLYVFIWGKWSLPNFEVKNLAQMLPSTIGYLVPSNPRYTTD